jgi:primosomal protein N' (replication factor Y)
MPYVEIAVNSPGGRSSTFVYSYDDGTPVDVGSLVVVPFGSAEAQGIVLGHVVQPPDLPIRPIARLLDSAPLISANQITLARWMSEHYCCPLIDALTLLLPPGVAQRPQTVLSLVPDARLPEETSEGEFLVLEALRQKHRLDLGRVREILASRRLARQTERIVRRLVNLGLLRRETTVRSASTRPRVESFAKLSSSVADAEAALALLTRAPRQRDTLTRLIQAGPGVAVPLATLREEGTGDTSRVAALAKRGLAVLEHREVRRDPLAHRSFPLLPPPRLTPHQEAARREIEAALDEATYRPFLLFGITGSGKTEVYLRTIARLLEKGKRAIVLVPEISLTPQTIQRFAGRFPGRLAVLHSRLTVGERFDEWRRIRSGQADVVIGSRSAIFAPVPNLGGIIVDEEHEWSYKQEKTPRYHARDVALKLAEIAGLTIVLGSATPSLETYYRAQRGQLRMLVMPERVDVATRANDEKSDAPPQDEGTPGSAGVLPAGAWPQPHVYPLTPFSRGDRPVSISNGDGRLGREANSTPRLDANIPTPRPQSPTPAAAGLPPVEIVDLRAELRAGNRTIFSASLRNAIELALSLREQAILFLNRRGDSTFVLCRDCGHVMRCTRCEAPFVYHSDVEDLVCHLCDAHEPMPRGCPNCWGGRIRYFGIGTQKLEAETRRAFPQARVLRWDRDAASARGAHEEILRTFTNHEADILVGTQMIAKGLDLPRVTLVGVISADTSLHLPDFRAVERTFQLLTQVAGRAGRGPLGGKVIIQTYSPEHYSVQAAQNHDYLAFYEREIAFRRQQGYPPFGELARLLYVDYGQARVQREAEQMASQIRYVIRRDAIDGVEVIGPAPAFRHKIRGRYRWQIVLRGRDLSSFISRLTLLPKWIVDVDPVSTL